MSRAQLIDERKDEDVNETDAIEQPETFESAEEQEVSGSMAMYVNALKKTIK